MADNDLVRLSGWGRTPASHAFIRSPHHTSEIILNHAVRGNLARGLGRSYGDAALNGGGTVWDMTGIEGWTITDGVVTVSGGTVLADLLDDIVPRGWFVPVTPGTKYVTMGGAVAADVHGKNHHVDGSIGSHLGRVRLLTGTGEIVDTRPGESLFEATVGGMGLTGIILEMDLSLIAINSPAVLVDTLRTRDLDDTMQAMTEDDDRYRYSVAWLDLLGPKNRLGRSVLTRATHPDRAIDAKEWKSSSSAIGVPDFMPSTLLNPLSMRAFNEAWYRKAPANRSGEVVDINRFFYPLDGVANWNRLYGRRGFVQYQVAVPSDAIGTVQTLVSDLAAARAGSFLVVLKRFGPGRGWLSFPIEGWTLAVDIPAGVPGLSPLLDRLDRKVVEAGGRTYFAKDSRTSPELIQPMYPELGKWRSVVAEHDPQARFQSDLDRRLTLKEPRP